MEIKSFQDLRSIARARGPKTVAVVGAAQASLLSALETARREGMINVILIGDESQIRDLAADEGVDLANMEIVHEPELKFAAYKAMLMLAEGRAHLAMKGQVDTATFLRAALDKEVGLRTGRLLSHVGAFDIKLGRLLLISDAGVNIAPDLEQKADIIRNAVFVAHKLGIEEPKVAVLASNEIVNPKMPANVEAAALSKMADRGQIVGALVDGPLALDNAISTDAAHIKGIVSSVAGRADILIPPDIEAGNLLAKALIYFASSSMGGVVVGAKAPLILPSRSSTYEDKLNSLAMGVVIAL
jgi:phosphate butyryltransferase